MRRFAGAIAVGFLLACTGSHGGAADDAALAAALEGAHRSADNRARDSQRHPAETLAFFGFRPDQTVVELWPGGGWYTEILAPALRERGRLIAASFGEDAEPEYRLRVHRSLVEKLTAAPEVYGDVHVIAFDPPERVELAAPGSVDLVLTFRNTHNWISADVGQQVYEAAFRALKPGGVLGVVQHRGEEGWDAKDSAKRGYVPESAVIALAEAAGFELDARSELNANPSDTKDYSKGVWTLPPVYRNQDEDRERYAAIGESDRMTLRFVKPR